MVAEIDGERLLIGGGSDGFIHAVRVHTGEEVWRFQLSQRGLNSSPVVADGVVYAGHSEENVDTTNVMGRLVAINAHGAKGDVTKTHEIWRVDDLDAGYASPLYEGGKIYMPDNGANLWAFDAKTGHPLVEVEVRHGGQRLAGDDRRQALPDRGERPRGGDGPDQGRDPLQGPGDHARRPLRRALRLGRLGLRPALLHHRGRPLLPRQQEPLDWQADRKAAKGIDRVGLAAVGDPPAAAGAKPAKLLVAPSVFVGTSDKTVDLKVFAFDDQGQPLGEQQGAASPSKGLPGSVTPAGKLTFDAAKVKGTQHGQVEAALGELKGVADLRIAGPLPWNEDFEGPRQGARRLPRRQPQQRGQGSRRLEGLSCPSRPAAPSAPPPTSAPRR